MSVFKDEHGQMSNSTKAVRHSVSAQHIQTHAKGILLFAVERKSYTMLKKKFDFNYIFCKT